MTCISEPALSILIATPDRAAMLARLLRSLDVARAAASLESEVVVVDNGSRDTTAALLDTWSAGGDGRVRLFLKRPGKSRALNHALARTRAPLLLFTDDDVEVPPIWIEAVRAFFRDHPEYDAAMGRVLVAPEVSNPEVLALVARYSGTVPVYDAGSSVRDVHDMYGCNMAVRRHVFERIGVFNERLGVGASGLLEDTDLAERICRAGMRIGYMPDAVIYHAVDPARLTRAAFRDLQLRRARSRVVLEPPQPWRKNLARWFDASLSLGWWTLMRNERRRLQAWARMVRHGEMLRLRRRVG